MFGHRLRCARKLLGLSQDRLGVLIGLDEHTASARISRYETGAHEPPIKTARLLAQVLGVPLAYGPAAWFAAWSDGQLWVGAQQSGQLGPLYRFVQEVIEPGGVRLFLCFAEHVCGDGDDGQP